MTAKERMAVGRGAWKVVRRVEKQEAAAKAGEVSVWAKQVEALVVGVGAKVEALRAVDLAVSMVEEKVAVVMEEVLEVEVMVAAKAAETVVTVKAATKAVLMAVAVKVTEAGAVTMAVSTVGKRETAMVAEKVEAMMEGDEEATTAVALMVAVAMAVAMVAVVTVAEKEAAKEEAMVVMMAAA